jgi:hypothetical protein
MKKLSQLFAIALVAAVVGHGSVGFAQEDRAGYATVVRVQGIASYSLGDGLWHPLVAGKKLVAGSTLRTGENGTVDVILGKKIAFPQSQGQPSSISEAPDSAVRGLVSDTPSVQQNAIRLLPGTVLAIDKLTVNDTGVDTVSDTELDLQKGKIFGSVKKLTPASEYLVKLPNGIAGIRGTQYLLGADDSAACFSSHSDGFNLVLIIDGEKVSFHVQPGEMLSFGTEDSGHHHGEIIPITPTIESLLEQAFLSLDYTRHVLVTYSANGNGLYISSITGLRFPHGHQPN